MTGMAGSCVRREVAGQQCAYFQFLSCSGKQPKLMRDNKPSVLLQATERQGPSFLKSSVEFKVSCVFGLGQVYP